MTIVTTYRCDHCGRGFGTKEEVRECERRHLRAECILATRHRNEWLDVINPPISISVRLSDGSVGVYKLDYLN